MSDSFVGVESIMQFINAKVLHKPFLHPGCARRTTNGYNSVNFRGIKFCFLKRLRQRSLEALENNLSSFLILVTIDLHLEVHVSIDLVSGNNTVNLDRSTKL